MSDAIPLTLFPALKDLMRWMTRERIAGTIVGAVAVSIRGEPRNTDDVDAVVVDSMSWERVLESAARYGFVPRIDDALGFAAQSRVFLLRHEPSGVDVDVSLGDLPFEREMIERSTVVNVGPLQLRILTAEDLVIMKALAGRPKDIADIDGILRMNRNLDLTRIRHHLREFSSVLEMPEIYDDFEKLLRRKQKGRAD